MFAKVIQPWHLCYQFTSFPCQGQGIYSYPLGASNTKKRKRIIIKKSTNKEEKKEKKLLALNIFLHGIYGRFSQVVLDFIWVVYLAGHEVVRQIHKRLSQSYARHQHTCKQHITKIHVATVFKVKVKVKVK
jgi:hypothetical protein